MASFEPTVVVFGSCTSVSAANLRLPVPFVFAFDVESLEQLVSTAPKLTESCLQRYFVVLLDPIDDDVFVRLETNYRVVAVYRSDMMQVTSQEQRNQMTNSFRQLTLNLSNDIVQFLTVEGQKQLKLERISLVKMYYQQARMLKEWMMTFFKAEPCHILLISLNSNQENLDSAQERLQKVCTKIGYSSVIIRQLKDYIPNSNRHSSLLPYAEQLFNNEKPDHMCGLIKKLSPIRLYLYGNNVSYSSEWNRLMIETEIDVMDDEDDWCAFLENEHVDDDIKWNFAFTYGREWRVSRVSPLNLNGLSDNPRFESALRRAHITFAKRQINVTAQILDWYDKCIRFGHLHVEPMLTSEQEVVKAIRFDDRIEMDSGLWKRLPFQHLSSFNYLRLDSLKIKSISFIWLDQILSDVESLFYRTIEPFQWHFFNTLSTCMSFIETQLRARRYIFLVASGSLGKEFFLTGTCLLKQIFACYLFCCELTQHLTWSHKYPQIHGVYNDSSMLAIQIARDYKQIQDSLDIHETGWHTESSPDDDTKKSQKTVVVELPLPLPVIVYNSQQSHVFMGHQRTIDAILSMPHTLESRTEMFDEFRRMYNENQAILAEVDEFDNSYSSTAAVQWYTRDSFVCRTINQALRSSDVELMFKIGYILRDIYTHLTETMRRGSSSYGRSRMEIFYRGQAMSRTEFQFFEGLRGDTISINTFLSATTSFQVALMYAGNYLENSDLVSVVFSIEICPIDDTRPYANISHFSMFRDEDEYLFAMGTVFSVGNIRQLPDADNVWIINLRAIDQGNLQVQETLFES